MAVVFPCDAKVKCGPSAQALLFGSFGVFDGNPDLEYDSPLTNTTTNRTDHEVYTAVGCGGLCVSLKSQEDANLCAEAMNALCGPFDGPNPPLYTAQGCLGLCVSLVSQADADLCATTMQAICDDSPGPIFTAQDCYGGTHVSLVSQAQADSAAAAVVCPPTPPTPPPISGGGNGGPIGPAQPIPHFPMPVFFNFEQVCCQMCPDGSQFCYAVGQGKVGAKTQQLADEVAYLMACSLAERNMACLGTLSSTSCCAGSNFDALIQVLGVNYPYSLAVESGALPVGVAASFISKGTIRVVGTPYAPGDYSFTLRITDKLGNHMSKSYTIHVVGISNDPVLTNGSVGVAYSEQLVVAGGTPPYTFTLIAGALPAGLTMATDGLISGTPTTLGTETFTVQVTDTAGSSCPKEFTLQIQNPGCVDWAAVSWVGISAQPARGLSSFTAAGGSLTFSANDPGVGPGGTPDVQDGGASFSFAAAADCLCRVTFNATSFNNPVLGGSNLNGGFTILQDGNLVLELVVNHGPGNPFNDGYYDSNIDGNVPHNLFLAASPIIVQFKFLASAGSTIVIRGKGIVPSFIWINASGNGENVFCDYSATFEVVP